MSSTRQKEPRGAMRSLRFPRLSHASFIWWYFYPMVSRQTLDLTLSLANSAFKLPLVAGRGRDNVSSNDSC